MKKIALLLILFCSIATYVTPQAIRWGTKSTSPGGANQEYSNAIAADSSGNTYITGSFTDSARFGAFLLKGKGSYDAFVAKLDTNGNYIWAKSFGGNGSDEGYGIAVDNAGNVYVSGYFHSKCYFSPTDSLTSVGAADMFAVKLDNNGNLLVKLREGNTADDYGRAIAAHATNGNFVLLGDEVSGVTSSFFVAKYTSAGAQQWNKMSVPTGASTLVTARGVATDNAGNVYLCGSLTGSTSTPNLLNMGGSDAFVAIYNSSGSSELYHANLGSTQNDYAYGIHCNGAGTRFYLCGSFTNSINFGNGVSLSVTPTNTSTAFVAAYTISGSVYNGYWAQKSPVTGRRYYGVRCDKFGNVIVADDAMSVYKYNNYAALVWQSYPGGFFNANSYMTGVAADKRGNVYASGMSVNNGTWGDSVLTISGLSSVTQKISSVIVSAPSPGTAFCISAASGDSILVTINPSMPYKPGNIFTLQMDNSGTGNFASPVNIGTLATTGNGIIHGYIPGGPNNSYIDLRVISSNPASTMGDQTYLTVKNKPQPVISASTINRCPNGTANPLSVVDNNPATAGEFPVPAASWTPTSGLSGTTSYNPSVYPSTTTDYIVTLTSSMSGCKGKDTVHVNVYPASTVSAGLDTSICRGTSGPIHATGTNVTSYSWTSASTLTGATTANPVSTPTTSATTYTVTGTSPDGCTVTDNVIVNSPVTTANAGPVSYNTCLGSSVQLSGSSTGNNGRKYSWSPSSTLNNSNISNPIATPTGTTMYTLTATDSINTCSGKDSVNIIIGPITVTANNPTITCANSATLTATPSAGNYITPLTYTWTPSSGLSATTGSTVTATPGATTNYYVTVTTGNGCSGTYTNTVTVNPPNFNVNFSATQQLLTTPPFVAQFSNTTPSPASYTFLWTFGDGNTSTSSAGTVFHTYQYNGNYDVTLTATSIATGCSQTVTQTGYIFCTGGTGCALSANVTSSQGTAACNGDSLLLTSNTGVGYTYQWNLGGSVISGATSSTFYAKLTGNYSVTISDGSCSVISQPKYLSFVAPPATPTITPNGNINLCGGGSVFLTSTSGYSSYSWSTGATTQNITVNQSGVYTVHVGNGSGCTSAASYSLNASAMPPPSICVVGVDSLTNQHMVVWDKPASAQIDSFIIYKEGIVANQFNRIGSKPYSSFSTFIDVGSNPAVQADRYKLSIKDTCGVETLMSGYHKTIHLTINAGMSGSWNLLWNLYEGFSVPTYNIYRGTTAGNITLLTSLAGTNTSYTDLTPPGGTVYYQIEGVNPSPCNPSFKIAQNYSGSRSNITNVTATAFGFNSLNTDVFTIYPNPTESSFTISGVKGSAIITVCDVIGKVVLTQQITKDKTEIDMSNEPAGTYIIKITGETGTVIKRLVKQ